MITDIKNRSVNCVIVKDLSRFGRNYIEVGRYIETTFPLLDIRFISVTDSVDSYKNPQSVNNIIIPFKNLINDEYCRDISNKVRSSLDMKRKQGKFIGSFASYGYIKDPADHNHLIVDGEAAEVVLDIYTWFIGGTSIIGIAKKLNTLGIPNPSAYKKSRGMNYKHPAGEINDMLWPDSSVRRILTNKLYTGTLVQGKNKTKSYKLQVSIPVPKQDWIEVENTHEAIIPIEEFEKAQSLLSRDTRTAPAQKEVYIFSGFIKCADCQRAMNRKLISQPYGEYHYYICSTFKKMANGACTKHTIRSDRLEEAVLETIRKQIELAVSMDELIAAINERGNASKSSLRLDNSLISNLAEKEKLERMKSELYIDWKNGDITKTEYHELKARFESRLEALNEIIVSIKKELSDIENGIDSSNSFLTSFIKYRNIERLNREIVIELIENIYVHEGGGITIKFNFRDEYEKVIEFVENNKKSAS